jgi:replicative DNA helicase
MAERSYPLSEPQPSPGDGRPATVVPHNREAEEAVLGAVLVSPDSYFDLVHTLVADDFFLHRNRWVWEAFTSLQEQRLPIDVLTVSEELERQDRLDEVGGPAYLAALIHNVPSTLHAVAYSQLVQETATRRRLLEAANAIARLAHASDSPIEDVVGDAEKAVFAVSERRLTRQLCPSVRCSASTTTGSTTWRAIGTRSSASRPVSSISTACWPECSRAIC